MKRIERWILRTLDANVNPLAYLFVFTSFAIGLFFTLFSGLADVQNTLLYKDGVFIGIEAWGAILLAASAVLGAGMALKKKALVKYGSMTAWIMWVFAGVTYVQGKYWYALATFAAVHMLAHAYLYLASGLDRLWRR